MGRGNMRQWSEPDEATGRENRPGMRHRGEFFSRNLANWQANRLHNFLFNYE